MKVAVIDLGTNTFHLIIAELTITSVKILYKTNVPVRLGQGRINENIIIPEAFDRGIATLRDFKHKIDNYQIDTIKAIATSAIRSAVNGQQFMEAAKSAGIQIAVISGDQEAEFIYHGVKATGVIRNASLIMDIGGGSTEFIICDQESLLWKKSYNIGAARLMQAYFKTDPISANNQQQILTHIGSELADLKEACQHYQPRNLIGSAGAFETFATLLLPGIDITKTIALTLDVDAFQTLSTELISSTHQQRKDNKGIALLRTDMIVIAALLTNYALLELGMNSLSMSTYDLKMGVLYSFLK